MTIEKQQGERTVAAVDLGSNSFHMIIAGVDELGHVRILDKLRESVRLRAGLNADNQLSEDARQRALSCLQRFGERIRDFPSADVAAVGTNTLRQAQNSADFLDQAEKALGHNISIISGAEEARLIYLGVAHTLAQKQEGQRFVMDIGGGSTELIIGEGFEPLHLESLNMGCVSSSVRFFPDGKLNKRCWRRAMTAARLELMPIQQLYRKVGWQTATGASGTIKSVFKMIRESGLSPYFITLPDMLKLQQRMIEAGHIDKLSIPGLSDERKPVIAGGLAILISTFEALGIQQMEVSDGALREGLVYDGIEQLQHGDLHSKTVAVTQARFNVDIQHAEAVRATAMELFAACTEAWGLNDNDCLLLGWAADLHELGLSISHSGYHKHGAYLLQSLDLASFSREEQRLLSVLVGAHRSKLSPKVFEGLRGKGLQHVLLSCVLLRIAVLLNRSRSGVRLPLKSVQAGKQALILKFVKSEEDWPLLVADLTEEKQRLRAIDFKLSFNVQLS